MQRATQDAERALLIIVGLRRMVGDDLGRASQDRLIEIRRPTRTTGGGTSPSIQLSPRPACGWAIGSSGARDRWPTQTPATRNRHDGSRRRHGCGRLGDLAVAERRKPATRRASGLTPASAGPAAAPRPQPGVPQARNHDETRSCAQQSYRCSRRLPITRRWHRHRSASAAAVGSIRSGHPDGRSRRFCTTRGMHISQADRPRARITTACS